MELVQEEKKGRGRMKSLFTKRKKIFILVGMFALLAITGYLNFTLNRGGTAPAGGGVQSSATFFTTYHAQRADDRAASRAILVSMSAPDSGHSEAVRANALAQLTMLDANIQYENTVENLIKSTGFADAITIKTTNDNINVIVKGDLTRDEQAEFVPNILRIIRDNFDTNLFGEFDIEKVFLNFMA